MYIFCYENSIRHILSHFDSDLSNRIHIATLITIYDSNQFMSKVLKQSSNQERIRIKNEIESRSFSGVKQAGLNYNSNMNRMFINKLIKNVSNTQQTPCIPLNNIHLVKSEFEGELERCIFGLEWSLIICNTFLEPMGTLLILFKALL